MQESAQGFDGRKLSRSPSITLDLGYYTLSPSHALPTHYRHNQSNQTMRECQPLSSVSSLCSTSSTSIQQQYNSTTNSINYFDKLIDEIIIKIFSYLSTYELCSCCTRVCRRWYYLTWDPSLWQSLIINSNISHNLNVDRGITTLLRLLSRESYCRGNSQSNGWDFSYNTYSSTDTSITNSLNNENLSLPIETIVLNGCTKLTDKSLMIIARKCSTKLKTLEIRSCNQTVFGISKILSKCVNLEKLDLTGCNNVCLNAIQVPEHCPKLISLDLSDCQQLDDCSLKNLLKYYGSKLTYLYLRRCTSLTDASMKSVATHCPTLKELSISYCPQFTDSVCYELSIELNTNLKYLSLANCQLISDAGLQQIGRHCSKLRYLNVRGCETISDTGLVVLARSCGTRLKSIDLGKCDVSDRGLKVLAEKCPNLRKLSVKECVCVSDTGLMSIAYNCRQLILLNIANCDNVTIDAYRYVKKLCRRCVIHHTNPGFS